MPSLASLLFKNLLAVKMGGNVLSRLLAKAGGSRVGWLSVLRALSSRSGAAPGFAGFAQATTRQGMKQGLTKGGGMGALLRFLLMNAVSVIGAKLINEATERASGKLFTGKAKANAATPDAPTLETRTCPKCGAFRVRGEPCACGA